MQHISKADLRLMANQLVRTFEPSKVKHCKTITPRQSRVLAIIDDSNNSKQVRRVRQKVVRTYGNFKPLNKNGVIVYAQ